MANEILLFGGSFNPVHNAHVAIVAYAHNAHPTAQIVVVPCSEHPFGKSLAPFADRVEMCRLAFAPFSFVNVSDMESARVGPSYTADTVRALQQKNPHAKISLIIGADAVAEMSQWHDAAWLSANVPLIVIPRGSQSPVPDISSSEIRARIAQSKSIADAVPAIVVQYLQTHALYRT